MRKPHVQDFDRLSV